MHRSAIVQDYWNGTQSIDDILGGEQKSFTAEPMAMRV
jgi:hypothetical protein